MADQKRYAVVGTGARASIISGRRAIDPMTEEPEAAGRDDVRPVAERLVVQRHWEPAYEVPIPAESGHHAGADPRLLDAIFRPGRADPLGQRAGYVEGLRSAAVGLTANKSIATGQVVSVADLGLGIPLG
jgi:hypothetical protein